jgi:hypothetical protein
MCGRVRLSSDVSEIKLVFSILPHRPRRPCSRARAVGGSQLLGHGRIRRGARDRDDLRPALLPAPPGRSVASRARAARHPRAHPPDDWRIQLRRPVMRDNVPCEFPAGYDGTAVLERLAQVLDPELGESILDLGVVRSLELRSGHADVALRLPTSRAPVGVRSPLNMNSTNITARNAPK